MKAPAAAPEPFTVVVEAVSWVNRFLGGTGSGNMELEEMVQPGETVRGLLRRLCEVHPRLREALWDTSSEELGAHIEIVVNDAILGIEHTLDSPLHPGDRVILMGQFIGG